MSPQMAEDAAPGLKSGRFRLLLARRLARVESRRHDAGADGIHGGREGGKAAYGGGGGGAGAGQGFLDGDAQGVPGVPADRRGPVGVRHVHGAAHASGGRARAAPAVPGGLRRREGGAGAVDAAPGSCVARHDGRGAALARVLRAAGTRSGASPRWRLCSSRAALCRWRRSGSGSSRGTRAATPSTSTRCRPTTPNSPPTPSSTSAKSPVRVPEEIKGKQRKE